MSDRVVARTILETAKTAGVGKSYIYQQIKCGAIRARKAGKRTLILDADLQEWLRNLPVINPAAMPMVEPEGDAE